MTIEVIQTWLDLRREEDASLRPEPDGYLFAHVDGSPIHPQVVSDCFEKLVKRSGLPRIRFHDYADVRVMPTSRKGCCSSGVNALKLSA